MPKKPVQTYDLIDQKLDLFKEHFDNRMGMVGKTLERMDERLDRVDVTMGKQQGILEEHVRRTNLLEEKIDDERKSIEEKVEPFKTQHVQVKLLMKIGVAIIAAGGLGGAGFGIKQLISAIFGE